jgi:CheY-like chemotaxis protein
VQMPGLDGLEATRRLRAGDGAVSDPRVPVVAITALADPDTRQACLDAGMDAVVTKPVNRESLLRALATVLG